MMRVRNSLKWSKNDILPPSSASAMLAMGSGGMEVAIGWFFAGFWSSVGLGMTGLCGHRFRHVHTGGLIGRLIGALIGGLIGGLTGCLVGRLTDLVGCLIGRWIDGCIVSRNFFTSPVPGDGET